MLNVHFGITSYGDLPGVWKTYTFEPDEITPQLQKWFKHLEINPAQTDFYFRADQHRQFLIDWKIPSHLYVEGGNPVAVVFGNSICIQLTDVMRNTVEPFLWGYADELYSCRGFDLYLFKTTDKLKEFESILYKRVEDVASEPSIAYNKTIPEHYEDGVYEAIKIIEHYDLNFNLGNVVKYVLRAGKKSGETSLDDLRKAAWYAAREVERLNAKTNH